MLPYRGMCLYFGGLRAPVRFSPCVLRQLVITIEKVHKWLNIIPLNLVVGSVIVFLTFASSLLSSSPLLYLYTAPLAMAEPETHRDDVVRGYLSYPNIYHDLLTSTVKHCVLGPFMTSLETDSFEWLSFFSEICI